MQLEQTLEMYQPTQMQMRRPAEQRQRTYTVGDLESLSASSLYMPGEIENGAMNWVGNIPTMGRSSLSADLRKFGISESVRRYGNHTIKTYVDLLGNTISAREQLPNQKHKDQMPPIVIDIAYSDD